MSLNRYDLYRAVRNELSRNYSIYKVLASQKGAEHLRSNTDLVIEGYPRSANSYVEAYIKILTQKEIKLAHHSHARSVVLRATMMRKPCLVLVRHPVDAAVSYFEESGKLSSPWVLLREYSIFYKRLECYSENILFCSFETATRRPEVIIPAVNAKFGSRFVLRSQSQADTRRINDLMVSVADERANIVPAYLVERSGGESILRDNQRQLFRSRILDPRYDGIRKSAEYFYENVRRIAI